MKNLFTIPMEPKENEKIFFQNYETKKISKETELEISQMNERISKFQGQYKHTYSKIASGFSFVFMLFLFMSIIDFMSAERKNEIIYLIIAGLSLGITILLMYIEVRWNKKLQNSEEYTHLGDDGEKVIAKAYEELGLVKKDNDCDVYLHYYREKDGKITNSFPYGAMLVKEYLIDKDEENLILGDIFSVIKIPLNAIQGINKIESAYVFYGWNKKDLPYSEKYKQYKYKSINNSMYFKARDYYSLDLILENKEVAILIAPYDIDKVKTLLNLE